MSELSGKAAGGHVMTIFSDFDVTNAAELEAHVNMQAIAAKANFDKYYAERLTDVSKLWVDQKRRLDVRQPFEVPTVTIECGTSGFKCASIPALFKEEAAARDQAKSERALAAEQGEAALDVDHRVDQSEPLQLRLRGLDYTNVDKAVAALLAGDCEPLRVDMSNNGLEADEAEAIATFVAANTCATALDVSGNKLGNDGVAYIAAALIKNTHITNLDLGGNEISKSGMARLAEALAAPSCALQRLQLGGNKLGIYGGEALAEALAKNSSLKTVGVQNNNLGNDGVQKLLDMAFGGEAALEAARSERDVVQKKELSMAAGEAGAPTTAVVEGNRVIVQFNLDSNKADDEVVDAIGFIVAANEQRQGRAHVVGLEASERAERQKEIEQESAAMLDVVRRALAAAREKKATASAAGKGPAAKAPPATAAKKAPAAKGPAAKAPAAKSPAARTSSPVVKPPAAKVTAKSPTKAPAKAPASKVAGSAKIAAAAGSKRSPSPKKSIKK